jgi:hypothetical protein
MHNESDAVNPPRTAERALLEADICDLAVHHRMRSWAMLAMIVLFLPGLVWFYTRGVWFGLWGTAAASVCLAVMWRIRRRVERELESHRARLAALTSPRVSEADQVQAADMPEALRNATPEPRKGQALEP